MYDELFLLLIFDAIKNIKKFFKQNCLLFDSNKPLIQLFVKKDFTLMAND